MIVDEKAHPVLFDVLVRFVCLEWCEIVELLGSSGGPVALRVGSGGVERVVARSLCFGVGRCVSWGNHVRLVLAQRKGCRLELYALGSDSLHYNIT